MSLGVRSSQLRSVKEPKTAASISGSRKEISTPSGRGSNASPKPSPIAMSAVKVPPRPPPEASSSSTNANTSSLRTGAGASDARGLPASAAARSAASACCAERMKPSTGSTGPAPNARKAPDAATAVAPSTEAVRPTWTGPSSWYSSLKRRRVEATASAVPLAPFACASAKAPPLGPPCASARAATGPSPSAVASAARPLPRRIRYSRRPRSPSRRPPRCLRRFPWRVPSRSRRGSRRRSRPAPRSRRGLRCCRERPQWRSPEPLLLELSRRLHCRGRAPAATPNRSRCRGRRRSSAPRTQRPCRTGWRRSARCPLSPPSLTSPASLLPRTRIAAEASCSGVGLEVEQRRRARHVEDALRVRVGLDRLAHRDRATAVRDGVHPVREQEVRAVAELSRLERDAGVAAAGRVREQRVDHEVLPREGVRFERNVTRPGARGAAADVCVAAVGVEQHEEMRRPPGSRNRPSRLHRRRSCRCRCRSDRR